MDNHKLIADIGMHDGQDTDFYLRKGFRVVAIEANPELVKTNTERFATYIEKGFLTIINAALGISEEPVSFYINDRKSDWSSIHRSIADRDGGEFVSLKYPKLQHLHFLTHTRKYSTPKSI